jgi:putative ABC transport system permease protein
LTGQVARQLEDAYGEAVARGETEEQAEAWAIRQVSDWSGLRRTLIASRRGRIRTLDRWQDRAEQTAASRRRGTVLADFRRDALLGVRIMAKDPTFACMAILVLALGIGANTAIFSVLNAVVLQPLPYRDSDRLVLIQERIPKASPAPIPVPAPDVLDFARPNEAFEGAAGFEGLQYELSGAGEPVQIEAARVGAELFPLLGVQPLYGRTFTAGEDQSGRRLAVLSYALWQSRFGADPNVVGRTVTLDRQPFSVIGVMPAGFLFPMPGISYSRGPAALWVPMAFSRQELEQRGDNFNIGVVARLKAGITVAQADAWLATVARRIQDTYPAAIGNTLNLGAIATPMRGHIVGKVSRLMTILLGAVGLVLLIACANVANLLLARAGRRERPAAASCGSLFRKALCWLSPEEAPAC